MGIRLGDVDPDRIDLSVGEIGRMESGLNLNLSDPKIRRGAQPVVIT